MQEKKMEQIQILNPLGHGIATRVMDENRKPAEWWWDYLDINEAIAENEFYVLFEDGLLVKKGRSKFTTSQYLMGEKFESFRQSYERN